MTPQQFLALFPAFASTDVGVIAAYITRLAPQFNVARWDDWYSEGLACAVAHMIVVGNADGSLLEANDIVSDETENRKITRDPVLLLKQSADWWKRSVYGERYVFLRDNMVGRGALVPSGFLGCFAGCV
jgi:hypothetical protein